MKKSTIILLIDFTLLLLIVSFVITTSVLGEYLILGLASLILFDILKSYYTARRDYKLS